MKNAIAALIVDGHYDVRYLVRILLKKTGAFSVINEAKTGVDALGLIADCPPQFVILDSKLSDMDGMDIIKHIRGRKISCKIVVYASLTHPALVEKVRLAGGNGFVSKSSRSSEVEDVIRAILNGNTCFRG